MKRKKALSILLLGLLSMLFAEIFSGASQLWFINPFGVLYTLPLYMMHTVFFLSLAIKYKKTIIRQLYWFGVLFGLYEAIITKVLWQGYMHETGPALGGILGVASIEFPILVFFWHPIFSFILPILTYQILSGHVIDDHIKILTVNKKKNIIGVMMLLAISTFILSGNQLNLLSALGAIGGTLGLITLTMIFLKGEPIKIESFGELKLTWIIIWLIAIYLFGGIYLMPERFPSEVIGYITVGVFYLITIVLLKTSKNVTIEELKDVSIYQKMHLMISIGILTSFILIMPWIWMIGNVVLVVSYFGFTFLGVVFWIVSIYTEIINRRRINKETIFSSNQ